MKKIISLLVAVIMLFSAIAVCAAPSVDYVFYDENDGSYYVFGSYTNNYLAGIKPAVDAGIYLNGTKYSYAKDGDTTNLDKANKDRNAKFGIELKASNGYFGTLKVQPYATDFYSEKVGTEKEYDAEANSLKKSSNSKLASAIVVRDQLHNYNRFVISPEFSPEVTSYVVYGYFGNATSDLKSVKIFASAQDSKATISEETSYKGLDSTGTYVTANFVDGEWANKKIITVTAEDGTSTPYTFIFSNNANCRINTGAYVQAAKSAFTEKVENGVYTLGTTNDCNLYAYPAVGPAKSQYAVVTFDIKTGMENAKNIALNTNNVTITVGNAKKLTIAAREYNNTDKLGSIAGKVVIPDVPKYLENLENDAANIAIDVTSIVKKAIKNNQTEVQIALEIVDLEYPDGCATIPTFNINYLKNTNLFAPYLIWIQ